MEIIIEPLVTKKQTALFDALIEKGYFATKKAARAYLKGIQNLCCHCPGTLFRKTRDGQYFASCKVNRRTTW